MLQKAIFRYFRFLEILIKTIFKRFYLFLERGEGREKEEERNIDVRNISWLPLVCAPAGD